MWSFSWESTGLCFCCISLSWKFSCQPLVGIESIPFQQSYCRNLDILRHTCSLLNYFQTVEGPCLALLHSCSLANSAVCECGQQRTMNHIVNVCPLTTLGGLSARCPWCHAPETILQYRKMEWLQKSFVLSSYCRNFVQLYSHSHPAVQRNIDWFVRDAL